MNANCDELKQILLDEGCGPGNSIHSWRCEYPALYSECNCVDEIVDLIVASEWLTNVKAEERAEVGTRFAEWAAKNEIASPPLDWAWFGEIVRWTGSPAHEANVESGDGS